MSSPSSNNEGDDAWLMKIELKREEPRENNKDDRIKLRQQKKKKSFNLITIFLPLLKLKLSR